MRTALLYLFTSILLLCWHTRACCQYYFYNSHYYDALFTYDIGLSAGGMNCLTDLGGKHETGKKFFSDVNWNATHPCGGLFAGINYNNAIGIRLELTAGQVSACDSILKRYTSAGNGRYLRNLSFQSAIREITLVAEFYLLSLVPNANFSVMPYIIAGMGCFSFDPQAWYNNSLVSLPALHTEGQGLKEYPGRTAYKLTQLAIPLGIGAKYELSPCLNLRCELTGRKLFTDYLDDVSTGYIPLSGFDRLPPRLAVVAKALADRRTGYSTAVREMEIRGNKEHNDTYFSISIKCSFVLGRNKIR